MFSKFQLAKKYLHYWLTASNGKGHGTHSPFVYDFINNVMNDKFAYPVYQNLEHQRKKLLNNSTTIEVEDFGAGSSVIKTNQRIVKNIAASSLKPKKYAQFLYRIVKYYKPQTIVELGTSFGITSAYMAMANTNAVVYTCEGASSIATIAKQNFDELQLKNVELIQGDFAKTLKSLLSKLTQVDIAFIDGNHRKIPTLEYFYEIQKSSTPNSIFIFDDIHWSHEMEAAWHEIKQHTSVTLTIDLFFIGIAFMNPDFKTKQHFTIRF